MAQSEMLKGLVKPPFATYDIVVYFGCGIFALPILHTYVGGPAGMRAPRGALNPFGVPFVDTAIATLFLLFAVYVLGHLIAYVASQIIERGFETIFGRTSSSILASEATTHGFGKRDINRLIVRNLRGSFCSRARVSSAVRLTCHLPASPVYLVIYALGIYGYWRTRVPAYVLVKVRRKISELGLGEIKVEIESFWYKPLEHYVINRLPAAAARMYNYLIISGLFRSLSFIILMTIWLELIVMGEAVFDGSFAASNFFFFIDNWTTRIIGVVILLIIYTFCACAYLKFQRRYVEEAIFAFVLEPDD